MPSRLTRWFPWGRKADPTFRTTVVGMGLGADPLPPNWKVGALTEEGFIRNITVYACVTQIARAVAGIPWVLMERSAGGQKFKARKIMTQAAAWKAWQSGQPFRRKAVEQSELENHPILALMDKPNPRQSGQEFFEALAGYVMLAGNSYDSFVGADTGPKAGQVDEMYLLRPDRTSIVPGDEDQTIAAFVYTVGSARQRFDAANVWHARLFHPTSDFYGLSPLQVAMRTVALDNEMAKWNHRLMSNEARPSGALVTASQLLPDVRERMNLELRDEFAGSMNAHRPLLLEGGVDWKELSLSPAELDFLASSKYNTVRICATYGVPPELVGDSEHKTYNSFPEARSSFYHETVLPFMDRIRDGLNAHLVPRFGSDRLFLDYDRDQIEAIQEDQAKLWGRLERATWLTFNEKRRATGYDDIDGGDELAPAGAPPPAAPPVSMASRQVFEASAVQAADEVIALLEKAQVLTRAQRSKQEALRKRLVAFYQAQGPKLAAHIAAKIREAA